MRYNEKPKENEFRLGKKRFRVTAEGHAEVCCRWIRMVSGRATDAVVTCQEI